MTAVPGTSLPSALLGHALLVGVGGVVGVAVRAVLEGLWPAVPGTVPWTTFGINIVGSLVLGALLELLARRGPDEGRRRHLRLVCGTGVVGGFTTYSTFAVEVERLIAGGDLALGVIYAVGSIVLGIGSAVLGIMLAATWHRRRTAAPA
jgi:fluoride exporter